ncbi:MAG: PadR family transcriptional regulator [Eubacteriales bacterium]|nr:PadR family transcriptional regulator [Eubacteriales bacterium]
MAVDKRLSSGSTAMLLLKLLSEKDMYGYEIIETLRKRSQNVFEMKAGTLYPLLHGLEEKGMLTVYEQEISGKVRKYYHLTGTGRKALLQQQEEWQRYAKAVSEVLGVGPRVETSLSL